LKHWSNFWKIHVYVFCLAFITEIRDLGFDERSYQNVKVDVTTSWTIVFWCQLWQFDVLSKIMTLINIGTSFSGLWCLEKTPKLTSSKNVFSRFSGFSTRPNVWIWCLLGKKSSTILYKRKRQRKHQNVKVDISKRQSWYIKTSKLTSKHQSMSRFYNRENNKVNIKTSKLISKRQRCILKNWSNFWKIQGYVFFFEIQVCMSKIQGCIF